MTFGANSNFSLRERTNIFTNIFIMVLVNIYRTNIFTKNFTNKSKCLPKYQKNKKNKNNVNVNVNDNVNVKWVNFVRASLRTKI